MSRPFRACLILFTCSIETLNIFAIINQGSRRYGRFDFGTEDMIPVFVRSHVKKPESGVFSVLFCPEAIRKVQGDTVVVQQR